MNNCCKNTDKEIWRQTHEDYYSPSIHVTEQGAIGIKCGGHVIVATVQAWHNWGKEALLDAVDHAVSAEPPKPTGEQLKAIGMVLDGDAPRACSHLDIIWNGNYPVCAAEDVTGKLRWHLKDAPAEPDNPLKPDTEESNRRFYQQQAAITKDTAQPAQMICDHAPIVHDNCIGCGITENYRKEPCQSCTPTCGIHTRKNYTPAQPEPAEPAHLCGDCSKILCRFTEDERIKGGLTGCENHFTMILPPEPDAPVKDTRTFTINEVKHITDLTDEGFDVDDAISITKQQTKEPKAKPGLVSYEVKLTDHNEFWIVCLNKGQLHLSLAMDTAGFHHIELKSGASVFILSAFAENDPPVKAYFRKDA